MIIDTHAHLYSSQFEGDYESLISRALNANVQKIFMPNVDVDTIDAMLEISNEHPTLCYPMLGLHPCDVFENYKAALDKLYSYFDKANFYAVGEIGLDLFHDKTFFTQQVDAFHTQINWALEKNLPIAIHSRNANDESIAIVSEYKGKGLKGVFHCFSGSIEQAKQMIDLGFYLGIGGVVTFKNGGLDVVLKETGLKNLVLETDAPYLAPVPYRGKRNEPSYLPFIVDKLADILEITPKEVTDVTSKNALALFSI